MQHMLNSGELRFSRVCNSSILNSDVVDRHNFQGYSTFSRHWVLQGYVLGKNISSLTNMEKYFTH